MKWDSEKYRYERSDAARFLRGMAVPYLGLDGRNYRAQYENGEKNGLGVGSITVRTEAGEIIREIIMGENSARSFFASLKLEAQP